MVSDDLCKRTSPYLAERLIYIGQLDTYESGASIASMLLGIETNDTAIYRLTDRAGAYFELVSQEAPELPLQPDEAEQVYAQMDGSMLLTREEGWKEVKLGRVFKSSSLCTPQKEHGWIASSRYVAYLGGHKPFEQQFAQQIDPYEPLGQNLIFICDGAKWQWNWIGAEYPHAMQILDFYHAIEHLGSYLALFEKGDLLTQSMQELSQMLKKVGLDQLIIHLQTYYPPETKKQQQQWEKLKHYFEENRVRMDYPSYLEKGLLIGSGAIESAHRTVIQKRMKLAGQRWSKKGAQRMLNLRVINMSGMWDRITHRMAKAA